ncbi:SCO6745 family protein [Streptomyces albipurpureus]|uniref:SalK n=1 Tax=Streptomyces albipurpureus TaxID=2897419 RepID=A0ABT0UR13_9ACTN|nr:hypothetical protein [Streptomyces sp. CWNU-1]MCM2390782.1 hypothetical protein [Streptomyces sp. CWNU-1]
MTTTVSTKAVTSRDLWLLFEPIHSVTYFTPEGTSVFEEAGLHGFWRGYFAGRSAPLGTVGAGAATGAFCSYAPAMVAEALPSVWTQITPAEALDVRREGARAALARLLAEQEERVERAAELLAEVATAPDCAGRTLAAANAALPWPKDPLDRLWQAATILREHRGDGYVAAQTAADLDGCEVLLLRTGIDLPRSELQPYRGWTDKEWEAAGQRLQQRRLLASDGRATEDGRRLHAAIEDTTDRVAARPWADANLPLLAETLTPLADAVAKVLRFPNPVGLPDRPGR